MSKNLTERVIFILFSLYDNVKVILHVLKDTMFHFFWPINMKKPTDDPNVSGVFPYSPFTTKLILL